MSNGKNSASGYLKWDNRLNVLILSLIMILASAAWHNAYAEEEVELTGFYASDAWYFSAANHNMRDPQPSIETDENGNTYTKNFHMQYNVYLGEFDFKEGTPTKLQITYSAGYAVSSSWAQIYLVLGENENSIPTRWWAGPWNITSTGTWTRYKTLTVDVRPGGSLQWPQGKVKVWLHNSRVGMPNVEQDEIHVTSVKIIGTKNLPEGDDEGSQGDEDQGAGTGDENSDQSGEGGTADDKTTDDKKNDQGNGGKDSKNLKVEKDTKGSEDFSNPIPKKHTTATTQQTTQPVLVNKNSSTAANANTSAQNANRNMSLARIAIAGEQGNSSGSTGGGEEDEEVDDTFVLAKDERDSFINLPLTAMIILVLIGGDAQYIMYRKRFRVGSASKSASRKVKK